MNLNPLNKPETETEKEIPFMYTEDQLMARLRFFIGICLALTLTGIVFVVLYSIIFVTQPLNAISPIDQKFFELIIPIATFLTGTLSGIMLAGKDDKEARMKALDAANRPSTPSPSSPMGPSSSFTSRPFVPPAPSMGSAMPSFPSTGASTSVAPPPPPPNIAPPPPPLSGMPPPPNIPRPL